MIVTSFKIDDKLNVLNLEEVMYRSYPAKHLDVANVKLMSEQEANPRVQLSYQAHFWGASRNNPVLDLSRGCPPTRRQFTTSRIYDPAFNRLLPDISG